MSAKIPPKSVRRIGIHTGNLLNLNELKIRAGQTPKDELLESLSLVLSKPGALNSSDQAIQIDGGNPLDGVDDTEERKDLKTSLKIFIPSSRTEAMHEALQSALDALGNQTIDSLVIAYHDPSNPKSFLSNLEALWKIPEEFVQKGKILRIGVSDLDTEDFISFYNNVKRTRSMPLEVVTLQRRPKQRTTAEDFHSNSSLQHHNFFISLLSALRNTIPTIKPSIVQINLSACCVVPPQLQEFTKQHDIQLLTHNDPLDILPDESFSQLFESTDSKYKVTLSWAVRYQIHVKCRGVLCSKGYLISAQKI